MAPPADRHAATHAPEPEIEGLPATNRASDLPRRNTGAACGWQPTALLRFNPQRFQPPWGVARWAQGERAFGTIGTISARSFGRTVRRLWSAGWKIRQFGFSG